MKEEVVRAWAGLLTVPKVTATTVAALMVAVTVRLEKVVFLTRQLIPVMLVEQLPETLIYWGKVTAIMLPE